MNVQITPLKTLPTRQDDDQDDVPAGRGRIYLIGGVALAVALGGFWYFTHTAAPPVRRAVTAPVKVASVEIGNMAVIERTIGTVMANSTVQINARIQGQMLKAYFKEGQMVKTGDILFQIDPRPYQAAYDNALAQLATAKAEAEAARDEATRTAARRTREDATAVQSEQATPPPVGAVARSKPIPLTAPATVAQ